MAVYPGTFDPFTPAHRDLVARARVVFDRIIVSLAVNADKQPTAGATARAVQVRDYEYQLAAMNEQTTGITRRHRGEAMSWPVQREHAAARRQRMCGRST